MAQTLSVGLVYPRGCLSTTSRSSDATGWSRGAPPLLGKESRRFHQPLLRCHWLVQRRPRPRFPKALQSQPIVVAGSSWHPAPIFGSHLSSRSAWRPGGLTTGSFLIPPTTFSRLKSLSGSPRPPPLFSQLTGTQAPPQTSTDPVAFLCRAGLSPAVAPVLSGLVCSHHLLCI